MIKLHKDFIWYAKSAQITAKSSVYYAELHLQFYRYINKQIRANSAKQKYYHVH